MINSAQDNVKQTPSFELHRIKNPSAELLQTLESYDQEAFGPLALRTYDLAVFIEIGAVYVAQDAKGEVLAVCQLMRSLDEPNFLYVIGFYVRPAWQKRGLGKVFLGKLSEKCQEDGAEGLLLTVSPDNLPALALYHKAGFVEEALVSDFYGEGEDRYLLRHTF